MKDMQVACLTTRGPLVIILSRIDQMSRLTVNTASLFLFASLFSIQHTGAFVTVCADTRQVPSIIPDYVRSRGPHRA